ncbi:MAG TPA: LytR C-terminal domain-containing protein [Acidimicrobiales bacterium]|nr:LytR C-terminal domain-containing protein [Acidimicrobiales bacterium]
MTAKAARAQGALAIAGLVVAVIATVVLVATPVSSRGAQGSIPMAGILRTGIRVDVEGGDPFVAYGVADRLTGAGASLGAVRPAMDRNSVEPSTMIVYYDREQQSSAEQVKDLLGGGRLLRRHAFEPGVDLTIVLGKDLSRL